MARKVASIVLDQVLIVAIRKCHWTNEVQVA